VLGLYVNERIRIQGIERVRGIRNRKKKNRKRRRENNKDKGSINSRESIKDDRESETRSCSHDRSKSSESNKSRNIIMIDE
jgi:hypothetical protein